MFLLLLALLSLFFFKSYVPGYVQFSNDGPFGRLSSACHHLPERFTGDWEDLNSIGFRGEGGVPNITFGLLYLLKPEGFAKFQALIALLTLGLSAWCFFKESGLAPAACLLGGVAAVLNSCFFSNACWGGTAHLLTIAMSFLAMAAILDTTSKMRWLRVVLAGFAVGMGVSEGDDVGALFSMLVAAFIVWRALVADGSRVKNVALAGLKVGLVAACAGWLAAQAVSELVATNIQGIHGTSQDEKTKEERWNWATQWSMPKPEALAFIVPGLFGYRMDTRDGGAYWGSVGQDALWQKYFASGNQGDPPKKGFKRYSGGGYYAGVPVVLVALWAALQALRRKDSVFSPLQRKVLWFWIAVGVMSLLFALGRWAPFYHWLYALPYFSTMRNPVKFIYFITCALLILFAYGVDGLWRKYIETGPGKNGALALGPLSWWAKAGRFEKNWMRGFAVALILSLLGWIAYANSEQKLQDYLVKVQFDPPIAQQIAGFSIQQVGWFVLFLFLTWGVMLWVFRGAFAGSRARQGLIVLGLLVAVDLGRANLPWIIYWELDDKYASNPIIDFLRDKPYEHRVAVVPISPTGRDTARNNNLLTQIYKVEWLQHEMPYFNIQSLDNVQMPRKTEALFAFEKALQPTNQADVVADVTRRWQLTSTRYVFGIVGIDDYINRQLAGTGKELHIVKRFKLVPKPGATPPLKIENMTASLDDGGPMALFEFTGSLPQAKLFSNWQVNTNDPETLKLLVESDFDAARTALVSDPIPPPSPSATNVEAGTTEIVSYKPKRIVLKADARVPAILVMNSRHDPNWHVWVDGHPAALLRCNYLVRGVALTPGSHTVEFRFEIPHRLLYVSLSAVVFGLALLGFVLWPARGSKTVVVPAPSKRTEPTPQESQPRKQPKSVKAGRKVTSGLSR